MVAVLPTVRSFLHYDGANLDQAGLRRLEGIWAGTVIMLVRIREAMEVHVLKVVDSLPRKVAERAVPEIFAAVVETARDMSRAEARGYVRVRSRRIVRRHTLRVVGERGPLTTSSVQAIYAAALERCTEEVVRRLVTVPSTQFSLRIAG